MIDMEINTKMLSGRVQRLSESATLAMARKTREMKAKGIDVIGLSLGEPDFDVPKHIKDAAIVAVQKNYSHYPPVPGYPELRMEITNKLKRDNNLDYNPEQIVVSTGAKQSIINVILSLVNPGDEVILLAPYWVSYYEMIRFAKGVPKIITSTIEDDYKVSAKQLKEAITEKTKLIILNSPCNPSGSIYSKSELMLLADVITQYEKIHIISDEIYEYINFTGTHESIAQFEHIVDKTIIVNGLSKAFAMTGWRLGYIAAPKWIADACIKIQGQITSGANTIAQQAALAALKGKLDSVFNMRDIYKKRRNLMVKLLEEIPGFKVNIPEGAFYLFPDISYYLNKDFNKIRFDTAVDFCDFLLNNAHVSIVGGNAFGLPGCVRISYSASEDQLIEAVERIKNALSTLIK